MSENDFTGEIAPFIPNEAGEHIAPIKDIDSAEDYLKLKEGEGAGVVFKGVTADGSAFVIIQRLGVGPDKHSAYRLRPDENGNLVPQLIPQIIEGDRGTNAAGGDIYYSLDPKLYDPSLPGGTVVVINVPGANFKEVKDFKPFRDKIAADFPHQEVTGPRRIKKFNGDPELDIPKTIGTVDVLLPKGFNDQERSVLTVTPIFEKPPIHPGAVIEVSARP